MQRLAWLLSVVLGIGLWPGLGAAQQGCISPKHHPWGCFLPGTWKQVRVVAETLDEQGLVVGTSTTETKTTLLGADAEGVTLEVRVAVEVAGKRFEPEPQTVKQGFHGEMICQDLLIKIKEATAGQVTIEGRKIPCKVQQIECLGPTNKIVSTVYYADNLPPYVLRRESVATEPHPVFSKINPFRETIFEVVALNMPCKVLTEMKTAAHVRTVQRHPGGIITTLAVISTEVPGGVISHTSKEVDAVDRLVRRSTLELVDYAVEVEEERAGLFGRRRTIRFRQPN